MPAAPQRRPPPPPMPKPKREFEKFPASLDPSREVPSEGVFFLDTLAMTCQGAVITGRQVVPFARTESYTLNGDLTLTRLRAVMQAIGGDFSIAAQEGSDIANADTTRGTFRATSILGFCDGPEAVDTDLSASLVETSLRLMDNEAIAASFSGSFRDVSPCFYLRLSSTVPGFPRDTCEMYDLEAGRWDTFLQLDVGPTWAMDDLRLRHRAELEIIMSRDFRFLPIYIGCGSVFGGPRSLHERYRSWSEILEAQHGHPDDHLLMRGYSYPHMTTEKLQAWRESALRPEANLLSYLLVR